MLLNMFGLIQFFFFFRKILKDLTINMKNIKI